MIKEPKVIPEKITILAVKLVKGNLNGESGISGEEVAGFNTSFNIQHGLNIEEKAIRFQFNVKLEGFNAKQVKLDIGGEFTLEFIFKVENLEDFLDNSEGEQNIKIHPILGATLVSIVYSTTRGMILSRTLGTALNGVILPVVDSSKLMKNEIK